MTARLICESCNNGYPTTYSTCPHCAATSVFAHTVQLERRRMDTECYRDYWLCQFDNPPQAFQLFPGHPLDIEGLRNALTTCTVVTFNGQHYDHPMVSYALAGATNSQLKDASDMIIQRNLKSWEFGRTFNINLLDMDHIDLFDVAPGQGSLKMYGGKMHCKKMQDLPIDPGASIGLFDRPPMREYCGNDLDTTSGLERAMSSQLQLREEMSAEYGIDLRSKSDAQIAEAVLKKCLSFQVQRPSITPGAAFFYRPPSWLQFSTYYMHTVALRVINTPFFINRTGGVSPALENTLIDWGDDQQRLGDHGAWLNRPKGWKHELVTIGNTSYAMGTGGLHSTEQSTTWHAEGVRLLSPDVAAYYPSLIVRLGVFPPQIGPEFQSIYAGWKTRRDEAKKAGKKKVANSLKTLNNGAFGKLLSSYSILYTPTEFIQITITGQLALLMLIDRFESSGIPVISANTDGIVVACPDLLDLKYAKIIEWWEQTTGFVMETTEFSILASRDVNSYVAITTEGDVKTKGAYAPPEPGASGWPNPTTQICVDAVIAYIKDKTPIAYTIAMCQDIRQFVSIRNVKGGGTWNGEYLGKAVRWYYALGDTCPIRYKSNNNKVAKTDGCRPLMELPDTLPTDIDYAWYIREAKDLLADMGYDK